MIDKELRERSLNAPARGDAAPREKILKLGKKITDVIDHKPPTIRNTGVLRAS